MRDIHIHIPGAKKAGFGLIELMVAVALGLLIAAAVTAMAVNSLKMSSDTLKSARLNQDMGAVMQIMVNDIRRVGYSYCDKATYDCPDDPPDSGKEGNRIFYNDAGEDLAIFPNCILYSYNRDDDADKDDYFGFRRIEINGAGVIQMADNTGAVACNENDNWVSMTDPVVIDVTTLAFSTDGSKCHNLDEAISVQIEPGASSRKFACSETDEAKLQEWGADGDGIPAWLDFSITYPEGTKGLKDYGTDYPIHSVGVRHVNILLEAELTKDSSVSKNLGVSIKVRNDHVYEFEADE